MPLSFSLPLAVFGPIDWFVLGAYMATMLVIGLAAAWRESREKSGTAEFGLRDKKGRLPFSSWFVAFVPKDPHKAKDDPKGLKAVGRTDSELVVLAFAYDSRTKGNAATEIVKYYLQMHYGIKKDYRNFGLLERGNFYQSN